MKGRVLIVTCLILVAFAYAEEAEMKVSDSSSESESSAAVEESIADAGEEANVESEENDDFEHPVEEAEHDLDQAEKLQHEELAMENSAETMEDSNDTNEEESSVESEEDPVAEAEHDLAEANELKHEEAQMEHEAEQVGSEEEDSNDNNEEESSVESEEDPVAEAEHDLAEANELKHEEAQMEHEAEQVGSEEDTETEDEEDDPEVETDVEEPEENDGFDDYERDAADEDNELTEEDIASLENMGYENDASDGEGEEDEDFDHDEFFSSLVDKAKKYLGSSTTAPKPVPKKTVTKEKESVVSSINSYFQGGPDTIGKYKIPVFPARSCNPVRVCASTVSSRCTREKGGNCIDTQRSQCSGTLYTGLCPGNRYVKCCKKTSGISDELSDSDETAPCTKYKTYTKKVCVKWNNGCSQPKVKCLQYKDMPKCLRYGKSKCVSYTNKVSCPKQGRQKRLCRQWKCVKGNIPTPLRTGKLWKGPGSIPFPKRSVKKPSIPFPKRSVKKPSVRRTRPSRPVGRGGRPVRRPKARGKTRTTKSRKSHKGTKTVSLNRNVKRAVHKAQKAVVNTVVRHNDNQPPGSHDHVTVHVVLHMPHKVSKAKVTKAVSNQIRDSESWGRRRRRRSGSSSSSRFGSVMKKFKSNTARFNKLRQNMSQRKSSMSSKRSSWLKKLRSRTKKLKGKKGKKAFKSRFSNWRKRLQKGKKKPRKSRGRKRRSRSRWGRRRGGRKRRRSSRWGRRRKSKRRGGGKRRRRRWGRRRRRKSKKRRVPKMGCIRKTCVSWYKPGCKKPTRRRVCVKRQKTCLQYSRSRKSKQCVKTKTMPCKKGKTCSKYSTKTERKCVERKSVSTTKPTSRSVPKTSSRCTREKGGNCIDTQRSQCSGTLYTGLCPGNRYVKCCKKTSGSSSSSSSSSSSGKTCSAWMLKKRSCPRDSCLQHKLLAMLYLQTLDYGRHTLNDVSKQCSGYKVVSKIKKDIANGFVFGTVSVNASDKVVAVVFKGTTNIKDWVTNVKANLTTCLIAPGCGRVHSGFQSRYMTEIRAKLLAAVEPYVKKKYRVLVGGFSLGGALALLASVDIQNKFNLPSWRVYTHAAGTPRVGDSTWAYNFDRKLPNTWRYVMIYRALTCGTGQQTYYDIADIVTTIPLHSMGYRHVGKFLKIHCGRCSTKCCGTGPLKLKHALGCHKQTSYVKAINVTSKYVESRWDKTLYRALFSDVQGQ